MSEITSYIAFQHESFVPANTFKTWTVYPDAGGLVPIVDEDNSATPFSIEETTGTTFTGEFGPDAVGTGDASWVDESVISQYNRLTASGGFNTYDITGLNDAKTYTLTVFSTSISSDRTTEFSIDGFTTVESVPSVVSSVPNTTEVALFSSVSPDSGQITLSVRDSIDWFGIINAMILVEDGDLVSIPLFMHNYRQRRR